MINKKSPEKAKIMKKVNIMSEKTIIGNLPEKKIYGFSDIDEILDRFDFAECEKIFRENGYKWLGVMPTIEDMRTNAKYLLGQVIISEKESTSCGTGRFYAYKFPWGLKLAFELESASSY